MRHLSEIRGATYTDYRLFGNATAWMRARPIKSAAILIFSVALMMVLRTGMLRDAFVEKVASTAMTLQKDAWVLRTYGNEHHYAFPASLIGPGGPTVEKAFMAEIPVYRILGKTEAMADPTQDAVLTDQLNDYPSYVLRPCIIPEEFLYVGYGVTSAKEGERLIAALQERIAKGPLVSEDIPVESGAGTDGTKTLFRLSIDLANKLNALGMNGVAATKDLGKMPVLIERPEHGTNNRLAVLFLDEHVESITYPGPFPMNEPFVKGLSGLRPK